MGEAPVGDSTPRPQPPSSCTRTLPFCTAATRSSPDASIQAAIHHLCPATRANDANGDSVWSLEGLRRVSRPKTIQSDPAVQDRPTTPSGRFSLHPLRRRVHRHQPPERRSHRVRKRTFAIHEDQHNVPAGCDCNASCVRGYVTRNLEFDKVRGMRIGVARVTSCCVLASLLRTCGRPACRTPWRSTRGTRESATSSSDRCRRQPGQWPPGPPR